MATFDRTDTLTDGGASESEDTRQMLLEKLSQFHALFFVTREEGDDISIVPMTVLDCDEDGTLWFAAGRNSGKVKHVERRGAVYLVGQSGSSLFVTAHANASLETGMQARNAKWSEALRVWFPGGPTDPEYALIRATVTEGEYWDTSGSNKLFYLADAVKAYLTKTRPEIPEGDMHGKLE